MREFLECVFPEYLDLVIWNSICDCLYARFGDEPAVLPMTAPSTSSMESAFPCAEAYILNGIITHLTQEGDENVQDAGVVSITASSNSENCRHVVNYPVFEETNRWISNSERNSWICFDFKDKSVDGIQLEVRQVCSSCSMGC